MSVTLVQELYRVSTSKSRFALRGVELTLFDDVAVEPPSSFHPSSRSTCGPPQVGRQHQQDGIHGRGERGSKSGTSSVPSQTLPSSSDTDPITPDLPLPLIQYELTIRDLENLFS